MAILYYGVPIALGFAVGFFFSLGVSLVLACIVLAIEIWLLWDTRNDEIGSLVGVIAIFPTAIFAIATTITTLLVSNSLSGINLSWLFRTIS